MKFCNFYLWYDVRNRILKKHILADYLFLEWRVIKFPGQQKIINKHKLCAYDQAGTWGTDASYVWCNKDLLLECCQSLIIFSLLLIFGIKGFRVVK